MSDKIISLGLKANISTMVTPADSLREALASVSKGGDKENCNKAIIILLEPDQYERVEDQSMM